MSRMTYDPEQQYQQPAPTPTIGLRMPGIQPMGRRRQPSPAPYAAPGLALPQPVSVRRREPEAPFPGAPGLDAAPAIAPSLSPQRQNFLRSVAINNAAPRLRQAAYSAALGDAPASRATGTTTTLPNGRTVQQYEDTPEAKTARRQAFAVTQSATADMMLAPQFGINYLQNRQFAQQDQDLGQSLGREYQAGMAADRERFAQMTPYAVGGAEQGVRGMSLANDFAEQAAPLRMAGMGLANDFAQQSNRGLSLANDAAGQRNAWLAPQLRQNFDMGEMTLDRYRQETPALVRGMGVSQDRMSSLEKQNQYLQGLVARVMGQGMLSPQTGQAATGGKADPQQQAGQTAQATVVKTGRHSDGRRVFQYSDGSIRDEQGNLVQE
jgi:hypothetical protein